MSNIYLYPKYDIRTATAPNPYMVNFEESLAKEHIIVNKSFNHRGVLDFFKYVFKADLFVLNWIENLSLRRRGKLQIIAFQIFLIIAKLSGKRILWVLHNKYTHDTVKNRWTDLMFKVMMRSSDFILTHSNCGIDFVKENFPEYTSKVKYIAHPVKKVFLNNIKEEEKFDFLLWGVILPYKGILQFLMYVNDSSEMRSLRILIVGKCLDSEYKTKINEYLSENIIHLDRYYEIEQIAGFAKQAKFILFTYNPESILSSGSLMDSIGMGSVIIGPSAGAFKDLSTYSFVKTFNSYSEIIDIYKSFDKNKYSLNSEIDSFCQENSWKLFVGKLFDEFIISSGD